MTYWSFYYRFFRLVPIYLFIYLSIYLPTYLSIYLSICMSINLCSSFDHSCCLFEHLFYPFRPRLQLSGFTEVHISFNTALLQCLLLKISLHQSHNSWFLHNLDFSNKHSEENSLRKVLGHVLSAARVTARDQMYCAMTPKVRETAKTTV